MLACCPVAAAQNKAHAVPNQYLLKFSQRPAGVSAQTQRTIRNQLGVQVLHENKLTGSQLVHAADTQALDNAYAKELLAQGIVEYIEPNYIVTINGRTPDDQQFASLWGMHNTGQTGGTPDVDIDAPEAWDLTTGSSSVVVGIVDTGIFYTHPDLSANMWTNTGEIPGNGRDDDGNGVVDDVYGYNALDGNGNPLDDNGHGTHCAGTIGGVGNNAAGVAGVNWTVRLMALKFLDSSGSGSTQGAISAIEYAVRMKQAGVNLKVLSNSWGGGGYSQALEDAIQAASNAGILFVAAAGNAAADNDSEPSYPANYALPNVVSVAAVDAAGNLAWFSNFGAQSVHLAAPGVDIVSTYLGGAYESLSGTSMATPHVSGVAALVAGREPSLSLSELRTRLLSTVKPLASLNGLLQSPGIVSAANALTNARQPLPPVTPKAAYNSSAVPIAYDPNLGQRVLNVDDGYTAVDLGFSFPYYGTAFPKLAISANGRVLPLSAAQSAPSSADYSNALDQGICPFHDDLYPSPHHPAEAGVWFKTDASSAVITWVAVNYAHRTSSNAETEVRVQLKLDAQGNIEFHYLDTLSGDSAFDYGASATVGLAPVTGVSGDKLTISHNSANPAQIGNNMALRMTVDGPAGASDYDGDGKSDVIVWRPGTGFWYILTSSSGFDFDDQVAYQLGLPGDVPLTGDFDGDKRTDLAVWRPADGTWYFRTSVSGYSTITSMQWGLPGDTPLVGDYDGDGKTDLAVYRRANGAFYVLLSSAGFNRSGALSGNSLSMLAVSLGGQSHDPVVGDFTGDGRDEFVTVWQLVRFWSVKDYAGQLLSSLPWGEPGDTPLACDVDGDQATDRVIVRVRPDNTLDWYTAFAVGGASVNNLGSLGDVPQCGTDYDGDGKGDLRVFRPNTGEWFIRYSSTGELVRHSFGLPGDIAL
jgi:thermitase